MTNKVIVIEDDYEFALIQAEIINKKPGFECIGIFTNPMDFLKYENISSKEAFIILLDILMPEINGLEAIPMILHKIPNASIIINSILDDTEYIMNAIQEGAVGYLDKQNFYTYFDNVLDSVVNEGAYMTPKIARKIFEHFRGKKKKIDILTSREQDVAKYIIDGCHINL